MGVFKNLKEMFWNNTTPEDKETIEEVLEQNNDINESERKKIENEFRKSLRDIASLEKTLNFDHNDLKVAKKSPKIKKAEVNLNTDRGIQKEKDTDRESQEDFQTKQDNERTR